MQLDKSVKIGATIIAIIIPFSGFVAWLTTIQINGRGNTQAISSIESKVDMMISDQNKMQIDIALIKQAVGVGKAAVSFNQQITPVSP